MYIYICWGAFPVSPLLYVCQKGLGVFISLYLRAPYFRDDSGDLQEEAGDDAKDGVVEDEDDDEGVGDGGQRGAGEGAGEVPFCSEKQDVADNGVEVHEHVLDHDVDVRTLPLNQEFVVDSSKDGTKNLDLKNQKIRRDKRDLSKMKRSLRPI